MLVACCRKPHSEPGLRCDVRHIVFFASHDVFCKMVNFGQINLIHFIVSHMGHKPNDVVIGAITLML